jgi:hypothetical protein
VHHGRHRGAHEENGGGRTQRDLTAALTAQGHGLAQVRQGVR